MSTKVCMLANKYFEHKDKVVDKSFTLTTKLDGIRCITLKQNGIVSMYSRQWKPIEHAVEIVKELEELDEDNFMLDGELLIDNPSLPSKSQYKETTKIVRTLGVKKGIIYHIFDAMSSGEYEQKRCDQPYSSRRSTLEKKFSGLRFVQVCPVLYSGTDTSQIDIQLKKALSDHQEGIMINLNNAPYKFTRSSSLLKVKLMNDCDLRVTGLHEGQGRFVGTLGSIDVDYKGNPLGVGSGFTDEERRELWTAKEKLIGRVITVQYFEETVDAKGVPSLRFPVFKGLRETGKEVSY